MQEFAALIGVVVGGLLTFTLTNLGERARWRRDQRVRWDAARLQSYTEYCNAVKRMVHISTGMAKTRGLQHSSDAVPLARGRVELAAAAGERTARWESVLLLGTPATIDAARAWHQSVWQLEFYARGVLTGQEGWAAALAEYERERAVFYRHARKDLGLEGDASTSSWPPAWYERLDAAQQLAVRSSTDANEK
ncbi:hypothetical protein SAMN05421812_114154 [Asanoa hainanensis]|uniref:Secreted protein n=1 Tax=Asanoa hainanensis TaxID=560556 RepID=A0A239P7L1_9ACTN|nr:hypothetical protein [Asanoa hainanensis]SNT62694.1 hypothetical protein SAMN05421812_114154 [Asanoa hainanensis]